MTNTYKTLNPIGSTSPKDLSDNASNFDEGMNAITPAFIDRFNRRRQTWYGMEQAFTDFLIGSGYEPVHLVYTPGQQLVVARPTQLIDYNGASYRVKLPASFPVTLSGTWASDQSLLVELADQNFQAQLANGTSYLVDSAIVGFQNQLNGALAQSAAALFAMAPVSVLQFIPENLHAAIRNGTSTTNVDGYINTALQLGLLLHFPQGVYNCGTGLATVPGGGIVGEGEKTRFVRRFTGGRLVGHPGGNQLDSPIILRDFSVRTAAGITVAAGDTGVDVGYATEWGGRGDISNLLIMGQWDGFKWSGGTMNSMRNIQCIENKGNGFFGLNGRGELANCLAQYNGGHGYFLFAKDQNETGIQFNMVGTFGNQGWGFLFDGAEGVIGANQYLNSVSSSTDGMGGIGFVHTYRQIWLGIVLIESAGDAYVPYPSFVKHDDAVGFYMIANCALITGSDLFIQNCRASGAYFDSVSRCALSNLISIENGRSGLGGPSAVGVSFGSNNIGFKITNLIADYGSFQTTDIAYGANNEVYAPGASFRTISGGGSGVRMPTAITSATKTLSANNPLNVPCYGDIFLVSGTTNFNSIPASYDGRRITLRFDASNTVYSDGNIKLQASLNVSSGSTLDLICDGINWYRAG